MPLVCTEEYNKAVSETINFAVDCTKGLDDGETLSGTPTSSGQSEMTVSNLAVTTTEKIIKGKTVAIGKAITGKVTGGTAVGRYEIKLSCATSSSPAQTRQIRGVIINLQAD